VGAQSAGILLFRGEGDDLQVLLVHPGGPFWAARDAGAWSIPKGEHGAEEEPLRAALREFEEELGVAPPTVDGGAALALGEIRQKGGKRVAAWALEGDLDPAAVVSNSFELEWPPRSGRRRSFPEVDRAGWFSLAEARELINPAQAELIDRLAGALA
jgi:predicted NUDIX family NTP pyrophosphohydrolase